MFASFAQGRSGTAPKHNPFAAVPSEGETNSFGGFSAGNRNQQKPTSNNPFQRNDDAGLNGGGAGQQKGKRGGRSDGFAVKSHGAGKEGRGKARTRHDADRGNVFLARQKSADQGFCGRAVSPSGDSSESESSEAADEVKVVPYNPADPLAKKVYERLRRDGISPPPWPSQPGNPNHKQAMTRFREQYEAYRKKVRISLTKAGLIDDPEKRKALSDAIEFKGICEDMCPEFEKITRITELDVVQAEKDPKTTYANTSKMVKKLARSAAGQEAPLPMDVRSIPSLRRTLDYLLDDLLRDDGNLPVVHGFLWDRTRAIRRDFSFFSSLTPEETKTQVYVLENIARFHVTSLHLLSQEGKAPEDFVQQQELEQLGKALLSLRDVYDDCGEQGIICENESEFRAYYLLFHAKDPSILETLQRQWKSRHWRDSDEVRTAVSLIEALQHTHEFHGPIKAGPSLAASAAFQTYFRIVQDPQVSYTMACFAECHFPQLRRSILQSLKRALTRPKTTAKDVTAAALNEFLQFDTVQQAIDFAEMHGLELQSNPEDPYDIERRLLVLSDRRSLPHRRLQHHYSEKMVERKRERRPLPEVIHRTVFEHAQAAPQLYGLGDEGSLFVQEGDGFGLHQFNPSAQGGVSSARTSSSSPFQNPWPVNSSFGAATAPESNAFDNQQASNSGSLGAGSQQAPTTANNPFASAFTSSNHTASTGFDSSTAPFSSFMAPKNDGASTTGTETLETSSQPSTNPFAAAPASSAPKFSFGDQSTTSSNTFPTSQSAFPSMPSSQTTTTTLNSSLSMPPPPKPQPSLQATSSFSKTDSQTSSPFGAFFPAQDQNTPVPGQSSKAHFGSATVDGLQPASSSTASFFSGAQKSTTNAADSASSPPMSPRSTDDPKRAPLSTTATASPDTFATSSDQAAHSSPVDISAQATDSSSKENGVPSTGSAAPFDLPRDPMGDFTKWFVQGDQGLLDQFQTFVVDDILRKTFATFQEDTAEKRRKEEEDRINAEVDEFRRYNLSLKYFYRWKQNAREKRLHALRRGGRDRLRAFYIAHHAAERKARHEAVTAKQVAETRADDASAHRQEEFIGMIKRNKKMIRAEARQKQALLSRRAGMPSNVATKRRGDEGSTVRQEFDRSRSNSNASSYRSGDSFLDPLKGKFGAKTRALREAFLGKPEGFRRSLPSMSSMESDSASVNAPTTSNASSRWKLKAMGIEQLPDGTAVPVSMAHDMRSRPKYYSSIGLGASLDGSSLRRASIGGGSRLLDSPMRNMADSPLRAMADSPIRTMMDSPIRKMGIPTVDDGLANRKRKRWSEGFQEDADADIEGGGGEEGGVDQNLSNNVLTPERSKPKRIMSEAEKLTNELRAMRQELENETEWFRSQNERFRSESRGPEAQAVWFDDGI
ncbi:hypothetical protein E4U17_004586 [Claviceps sp. LM77 group G4]|nr:hypothetical protein E4U17_004586 [Claviceps sp. LM77 group G4]KAG6060903.1 hypothetical protein E4U33_006840 [Claviceps sp. LM78 group G4]KAG6070588.1 hypothetical protein E4U16_006751 [Claviceps sp. LM84 group G4]